MVKNFYYQTKPLILHNPFNDSYHCPIWKSACMISPFVKSRIPENITIVTWNNGHPRGVQLQLQRMKIPHLVLGQDIIWEANFIKLSLLLESMHKIKTKYILAMDCFDVIIAGDLFDIVDRFQDFNCSIVFNATPVSFPNIAEYADKELEICSHKPFCYLNSGVFIGETKYVKYLFEKSIALKDDWALAFPKSDQRAIRSIYHYSYPDIQIDHYCKLFQVMHIPSKDVIENYVSVTPCML